MSISDSSCKFDLYGILVLAAFVYLSNQFTWSWAHCYHYFSPLGFLNGWLFVGNGGSPGPFEPASENRSVSDSNYRVEWYGSLVYAAFVFLSDHSLRSAAHAYHYFSPLGFLSGALFFGCSGRPGPFGPANANLTPTGFPSNCENLTGCSFPLSATLIYSPSGSSAP